MTEINGLQITNELIEELKALKIHANRSDHLINSLKDIIIFCDSDSDEKIEYLQFLTKIQDVMNCLTPTDNDKN